MFQKVKKPRACIPKNLHLQTKNMGDFEEIHSIAPTSTETLLFSSQDFRVVRILLRLLSLWRPRSAGVLESYVYPVFVNLLLLTNGPIRNSIIATENYLVLMYMVHEVIIWLGHIFGNRYFASRDLETNVLTPVKPLTRITKPLNRKLKILNVAVVISFTFFSIMLCTLAVMTQLWSQGTERFSSDLPHVHGAVDHIWYAFILVAIVYNLGVGLALFWTLALLYSCYAARLTILENMFLKWKHSSADAVSFFMQSYARPVQNSWKRISLWFLANNIVALAIPLFGYELAQAVSGSAYHMKQVSHFVCYSIFIASIWLAPIVVGEQIKRRERKFMERINDISPWLLETESHQLGEVHSVGFRGTHSHAESGTHSLGESGGDSLPHSSRQTASLNSISQTATEGSGNAPKYTFAFRGKELKKFLEFLKGRTPGLVSRGYSIQLNLSLISLIGGAILFLFKLHSMNSEDTMYRNRNCTMS